MEGEEALSLSRQYVYSKSDLIFCNLGRDALVVRVAASLKEAKQSLDV